MSDEQVLTMPDASYVISTFAPSEGADAAVRGQVILSIGEKPSVVTLTAPRQPEEIERYQIQPLARPLRKMRPRHLDEEERNRRRAALDELTRLSEDMDLYDRT